MSHAKFSSGKLKDLKLIVEYYQYERKSNETKPKVKKKPFKIKEDENTKIFEENRINQLI